MITRPSTEFESKSIRAVMLHCGGFVTDPAGMWNGADGQSIYFHGRCVYHWLPGFLRDVSELQYAGKPRANQI